MGCEYLGAPITETGDTGLFTMAGTLLAPQLMEETKNALEKEYQPNMFKCNGFRPPAKETAFISYTPVRGSRLKTRRY